MLLFTAWPAWVARLVGLGVGFALASATAQELTVRTQTPPDMSATPPGPIGPGAVRIPDRGFPANVNSPVARSPAGPSNSSSAGPSNAAQGGPSNPLWAAPLTSLSNLRERPIFSVSRRPASVAVPAAPQLASAPSEPDRPLLALLGAVAGTSDGIAIFRDEATKGIVRVKTGESHSGWILRAVEGREATLQKGPKTVILMIAIPSTP